MFSKFIQKPYLVWIWVATFGTFWSCSPKTGGESPPPSQPVFNPKWDDNAKVDSVKSSASSSASAGDCAVPAEDDMFKILNECGILNISDKTKKTLQLTIPYNYTRLINAGVARAVVPLTGVLNLDSDLLQSTLNVGVDVRPGIREQSSEDGCNFADRGSETLAIKNRADFLTKTFRGPVVNKLAEINGKYEPAWRGVQCTILRAISLTNDRGEYHTEVEFDTPYVPNISPIAIKSRYEKELGDFKIFRNIGAKVVKTNNPVLKEGRVYRGNIVVEKVPPVKAVIMDPSGQRLDSSCDSPPKQTTSTTIQGDTAYRVTNHFGTDEETLALGFHLWTEYYIDHNQKNFSAVIANVGDDDLMYFVGEYTGTGNTATNGGATAPTYNAAIRPIIAASCGGSSCHLGGSQAPNLGSYEEAKSERVLTRVLGGTMPPGGGLSAENKQLFSAWQAAGYLP